MEKIFPCHFQRLGSIVTSDTSTAISLSCFVRHTVVLLIKVPVLFSQASLKWPSSPLRYRNSS